MTRRLAVVSAGLSTPSSTRLLADRISDAVRSQVGARGEDLTVSPIEVREVAVGLATTMSTAGLPVAAVEEARAVVERADGLVAVTPVFAAGYSGLFKMFFDTFDPHALAGKPVLIAATAGTPRHSLVLDHAMRPLFTWFGSVVVPTGVFAATEDFGSAEEATGLGRRITRAASELAGLIVATPDAVAGFIPGDPAEVDDTDTPLSVTSFSDLLRGHDGTR